MQDWLDWQIIVTVVKKLSLNGNSIAYVDEGSGPCLVFVHGTPVSSDEFTQVIDRLKKNYRCIAIDHLGFGTSVKPADGDYSLTAHRQRLSLLLDALQIQKFHLIVTDFGGPIGLPLAINRWDDIRTLTILNSWIWPLEETEPQLKKMKWLMTSKFMKFLYLYFNFSAKVMLKLAWGTYRPLTSERHRHYQSVFQSPLERMGTLGFLKAVFATTDPTWKTVDTLKILSKKPTLIIWGQGDKFISTRNLEKWKTIFTHSEVHILKHVGHFVSEEAPDLVAPIIERFMAANPRE